jgi:hypothetical protein
MKVCATLVNEQAKKLYYRHMGYRECDFPFLWKQCSEEYRNAWRVIARGDLE